MGPPAWRTCQGQPKKPRLPGSTPSNKLCVKIMTAPIAPTAREGRNTSAESATMDHPIAQMTCTNAKL